MKEHTTQAKQHYTERAHDLYFFMLMALIGLCVMMEGCGVWQVIQPIP